MPSGSNNFILKARNSRAEQLAKHADRKRGGSGKEASKEADQQLVADALAKGKVTKCEPGTGRPDMRKRHRGY